MTWTDEERDRANSPDSMDKHWQAEPPGPRVHYVPVYMAVVSSLGPKDKVLDVGCGNGAFLHLARQRCGLGVGVDHSRIACLKTGGEMYCKPFPPLEFGDSAYNVVTCFEVVEHLRPGDAACLVMEMNRVLRPGGHCWVAVPNKSLPPDQCIHHRTVFDAGSLRSFLTTSGAANPAIVDFGHTLLASWKKDG